VSPGFLVTYVVGHYQNEDSRYERTGAADSRVEYLTTGSGAGGGNQDLFGADVALVFQADLLPSKL